MTRSNWTTTRAARCSALLLAASRATAAVFHSAEYLDADWGKEYLDLPCNAVSLIELVRQN